MAAETSPVKAPPASGCMFWAPRAIRVPSTAEPTAARETKGGQSTVRTPPTAWSPAFICDTSSVASSRVVFIFQLAAISVSGMQRFS